MSIEVSGAQWCTRFPGSASLDDLIDPFKTNASRFIQALRAAQASVDISATYRPPERAYLMHFACLIAGYRDKIGGQFHQASPETVPPMAGVDIDWTHCGDFGLARTAAVAMRLGYGIAFPAALVSRHTQRLAVDMSISIPAGASVLGADGRPNLFATAANGSDPRTIAVGKTYNVIKLPSDPPHWSSDGH